MKQHCVGGSYAPIKSLKKTAVIGSRDVTPELKRRLLGTEGNLTCEDTY
jgi:hypothetical protein